MAGVWTVTWSSSQLTLTKSGEVNEYLGSTSQQARSQMSQHNTDSKYERYKNRTNLAKSKWSLRDKNVHLGQRKFPKRSLLTVMLHGLLGMSSHQMGPL